MQTFSSYADHMQFRISEALKDWDYREACCEEQAQQEAIELGKQEGFLPEVYIRNLAPRRFLAQNNHGLWEKEVFQVVRDIRIARVVEPFPGTLYIETHGHATTEQLVEAIHLAYLPW